MPCCGAVFFQCSLTLCHHPVRVMIQTFGQGITLSVCALTSALVAPGPLDPGFPRGRAAVPEPQCQWGTEPPGHCHCPQARLKGKQDLQRRGSIVGRVLEVEAEQEAVQQHSGLGCCPLLLDHARRKPLLPAGLGAARHGVCRHQKHWLCVPGKSERNRQ